jgi:hypothetical protein
MARAVNQICFVLGVTVEMSACVGHVRHLVAEDRRAVTHLHAPSRPVWMEFFRWAWRRHWGGSRKTAMRGAPPPLSLLGYEPGHGGEVVLEERVVVVC